MSIPGTGRGKSARVMSAFVGACSSLAVSACVSSSAAPLPSADAGVDSGVSKPIADAGRVDADADSAAPRVDAVPETGVTCAVGSVSCGGACTATATDVTNCGACGNVCPTGEVCSAGTCGLSCTGGTTLCGASCSDEQHDPANCGGCGTVCKTGEVCSLGACALACGGGTTQCGSACVDEKVDPANCGGCGTTCGAGLVCSGGACAVSCTQGLTLCGGANASDGGVADAGPHEGGSPSGGVCINLQTDRNNCDACGAVCPSGEVCNAGSCSVSCPTGELNCSGRCIDPTTDNEYCGASATCTGSTAGAPCAAGNTCSGSVCGLSCAAGQVICGGACVDPTTSNAYCGASSDCTGANSGTLCASGQTCSASVCVTSCPGSQIVCNGSCVDPTTSNQYCGASLDCNGANAGSACAAGNVCSGGQCLASCQAGLATCGDSCADLNSDPSNCGACATTCGTANAAGFCSSGTCALDCQPGYADCNGVNADGCEAATSSDPLNCGACGNVCGTSTPFCVDSACTWLEGQPWQTSSSSGSATLSAAPASGSADAEQFTYDDQSFDVFSGQTFELDAVATDSRTVNFAWSYTGFHAYFEAVAGLTAFADGPGGTTSITLVASQSASGGFSFSGTSSLTVTAGYAFGVIASGQNFDSTDVLEGTVTLTRQ